MGSFGFRYIAEKDRPLNIPYPQKWIIDAFAAHPVVCLILWCLITGSMIAVFRRGGL